MTRQQHTEVLHTQLGVSRVVWVTCRAAAAVRAIFVDFDARFEAGSLDEAYLDVTDYCKQHGLTGKHEITDLLQILLARKRDHALL